MVTAAMSWEKRLKAKADRRSRYEDRQEFDRVTLAPDFPRADLVRSGRAEDYLALARVFAEAGKAGATRHAELIADELRKAHKRANRTLAMLIRHLWKDLAERTRFDLLGSCIHSCREGGPGWFTDSRFQFRVKPEDRAEVAALGAFHKRTDGKLLDDDRFADVWSQCCKGEFEWYPTALVAGYTFSTSHRDTVCHLAAHIDGPFGQIRLDMDYLGFVWRYFPGAMLRVPRGHGDGRAVVIHWNGEDVGLVMAYQGW